MAIHFFKRDGLSEIGQEQQQLSNATLLLQLGFETFFGFS
jgi:hypothetical protein